MLSAVLLGWMGMAPSAFAGPIPLQAGEQTYTVRPNDTLGSIASSFRVTVASLLAANPGIQNPNRLTAGQQITIPAARLQPGQSIWSNYTGIPATGGVSPLPQPASEPPPSSPPPPPASGELLPNGVPGSWKLIFQDEFDGSELDGSKWITAFPWGRTSTTTPRMIYRPENVLVSGGTARLVAKKEAFNGYPYTSGIITTSGKFTLQYGFIEMRARVPGGKGLWPAFWTLPPNGKWPPEIDIMEILGHRTETVHLHYHFSRRGDFGTQHTGPDFTEDWHTFAVSWQPDSITWYVDGVEQNRLANPAIIAAEPMYLVANLQVGGSWPGNPDATTPFPATYEIDYIRAWQE